MMTLVTLSTAVGVKSTEPHPVGPIVVMMKVFEAKEMERNSERYVFRVYTIHQADGSHLSLAKPVEVAVKRTCVQSMQELENGGKR